MNDWSGIAKLLMVSGGMLALIGGVLFLAAKGKFLGQLPGDIILRRENFTVYLPLATSLLLSVLISLIFWFFFGKR